MVYVTTKQPKNDFSKKRQIKINSNISKKFQNSFNFFSLIMIFCLFYRFLYHLFTKSNAKRNNSSNIYDTYCIF